MWDFWRLPSPSQWLSLVAADRASGLSGVIVCPSLARPPSLASAIRDSCPRSVTHLEMESSDEGLVVTGEPGTAHVRLLALLIRRLGLDCVPDPVTLVNHPLLGRTGLVADVRSEPLAVQSAWAKLVGEVAEAARSVIATSRPTLWVITAAADSVLPTLPRPDVCLAHHWFWGVLGPVDVLVGAKEAGLDDEVAACATEVVRWDIDMLRHLPDWDGTVSGLHQRSLGLPDITGVAIPAAPVSTKKPSAEVVGAWSLGLLEKWDGRVCPHVAFDLAAREDAIITRIWAGQIARVLPFIELERARIARWLAEQIVRSGGVVDTWSAEHGDDVAGLEIGPLWACVHAHRNVRVSQSRFELMRDLKDTRNAIAHRRPIPVGTIRDLRRRAERDRSEE